MPDSMESGRAGYELLPAMRHVTGVSSCRTRNVEAETEEVLEVVGLREARAMARQRQQAHHEIILKAYERVLEERVALGEMSEGTKLLHLQRANRIFEGCLRGLSCEGLLALIWVWFAADRKSGGGYRRVIRDLKALVDVRERQPFLRA